MVDIHNYQRRAEQTLLRLDKLEMSSHNKQKIKEFYRHCATETIGLGKSQRYVNDLMRVAIWLNKDFNSCTKEDIENIIIDLDKRDYSEWTKYGFKIVIKKFFKWLNGNEEFPPEVKWLKIRQKNCNNKLPEELLTESEVKKLIECASKERDKAFISMLYETGCRIGEVLTLKIKNISFDELGARVSVFGKTGSRRVRIISSVSYLQSWLNKHPDRNNVEAFIWIREDNNELIGYNRIRILLSRLAKKAGISKKVNPHSFRHSRASFLANYLTESQLKEVLGWDQASKMASVYVHLSGRNTDEAILRVYGREIDVKKKDKSVLHPKDCLRCQTSNETTHRYCKLCGMPLDKETQQEIIQKEFLDNDLNKVMSLLLKDKDVLNLLAEKMVTLKGQP